VVALLWAATQGRPYKNRVSLECTNLLPSGLGEKGPKNHLFMQIQPL
jgi:hypothetical protein